MPAEVKRILKSDYQGDFPDGALRHEKKFFGHMDADLQFIVQRGGAECGFKKAHEVWDA